MQDTSTNPQDLSGGTQRLSSGTPGCNNVTQDLSIRVKDRASKLDAGSKISRYDHQVWAAELKTSVTQVKISAIRDLPARPWDLNPRGQCGGKMLATAAELTTSTAECKIVAPER